MNLFKKGLLCAAFLAPAAAAYVFGPQKSSPLNVNYRAEQKADNSFGPDWMPGATVLGMEFLILAFAAEAARTSGNLAKRGYTPVTRIKP